MLVLRLVIMWLQHRYDPKMVRLRELTKVKEANDVERIAIEKAVADGDTAALSRIWDGLHASDRARGADQ